MSGHDRALQESARRDVRALATLLDGPIGKPALEVQVQLRSEGLRRLPGLQRGPAISQPEGEDRDVLQPGLRIIRWDWLRHGSLLHCLPPNLKNAPVKAVNQSHRVKDGMVV